MNQVIKTILKSSAVFGWTLFIFYLLGLVAKQVEDINYQIYYTATLLMIYFAPFYIPEIKWKRD